MPTPDFIDKYLQPIFNDRQSGSGEILLQLKDAVRAWAGEEAEADEQGLRTIAQESLNHLGHFAVVVHFLDQLLVNTRDGVTSDSILHFLEQYDTQWAGLADQHAKHLRSLQPIRDQTVLLHSHSSSIVNLFEKLAEKGDTGQARIFQSISHPQREGLIQGERLAKQGWKVILIEDAAMGRMLTQCDYVILGSDVITASTFVNKTGSMPVTAAAKLLQIPVYVLGDERKLVDEESLPEWLAAKLLNEYPKSDRELHLNKGQSGLNYHFEHVPTPWVNAFLLQGGIYTAQDLKELSRKHTYSSELITSSRQLGS